MSERKAWLAQIEDGSMRAQVVNYYSKPTVPYDAHALQIAAKQNTDANCWINTLLLRIKALQAELEAQRANEPVPTDELEQKPRYTMAELLAQCEPVAVAQEEAIAAVKFWQMSGQEHRYSMLTGRC